jgi:hypothetical protein
MIFSYLHNFSPDATHFFFPPSVVAQVSRICAPQVLLSLSLHVLRHLAPVVAQCFSRTHPRSSSRVSSSAAGLGIEAAATMRGAGDEEKVGMFRSPLYSSLNQLGLLLFYTCFWLRINCAILCPFCY